MKARKVTRASLAAEAAARWADQYGNDGNGYGSDKAATLCALRALGQNPSPDEVDRVIGNRSWTQVPACDACDADDLPAVVVVGQEPDYESATAHLCGNCVADALRVITSE